MSSSSPSAGPASAVLLVAVAAIAGACARPAAEQAVDTSVAAREAMYTRYLDFMSLVRGGTVTAHWNDDGSFWYDPDEDGGEESAEVWRVDPASGSRERVPRPQIPALEEPRVIREARFPGFPPIRELPSPDGRFLVTEKDHDLWLRRAGTETLIRLTAGGGPDFDWRIAQEDLWSEARLSPDGRYVAVLKEDRRGVPREPLVDWLRVHPEVEWIPFSKAGESLARTEVHIIDLGRDAGISRPVTRRIELGDERDRYFHLIGFVPDSAELLFLDARRDFRAIHLRAADARSGRVRTILEERAETFVKNMSLRPEWTELLTLLPKRGEFLWLSERDGFDHLYRYDLEGRLLGRLTRGAFPLVRVVAVDDRGPGGDSGTGGWVYVLAHAEPHPYETHLYRVPLDGDPSGVALERLTEAPGQHEVTFSPGLDHFLDTHSRYDRPPRTELRRADGTLVTLLEEADATALEPLAWQPPEPFVAKAADGVTDVHGLLYKPWDFDPERSYPLIEHIYGGPFIAYVPWGFFGNRIKGTQTQALAQLGYVTMIVDTRGTPERGKAFQDVVFRNFGRHEIPDRVAVLDQLCATRPYLDCDRVGVFGGSWGGYMAVRAMLLAPELYKVGVATNPVYDFVDHGAEGMEAYLGGKPQDDPEPYAYGSSLRLADRLEGKLMLIHATNDRNATFSATMKMVDALIQAQRPFDLLVLPGQDHHPQGAAHQYRLDAHKRYFLEHLSP